MRQPLCCHMETLGVNGLSLSIVMFVASGGLSSQDPRDKKYNFKLLELEFKTLQEIEHERYGHFMSSGIIIKDFKLI